jgi:alkylresorcinol/alkylpyrone synthase
MLPKIISVGEYLPPHQLPQETTVEFAKELFQDSYQDVNRLLKVFSNGHIEKRHFAKELTWFKQNHTFEEKNNIYIEHAVSYGCEAIKHCLGNALFLKKPIDFTSIEAIFFVSTTGLSTPSIEARIMNILPFSPYTKRIPIWGLGCAGGVSGIARAYEYCKAFPKSCVIVLAVELCSITFQKKDKSKSNLIGMSLFADGVACVCVAGDEADVFENLRLDTLPTIMDSQSCFMNHSEDVMGWNIKNEGLYVVFSKDIPTIIRNWLRPVVDQFLEKHQLHIRDITCFIAHPGGKKVLEAYEEAFDMKKEETAVSLDVLKNFGNMSSVTVIYVLKKFMERKVNQGEYGLMIALGPGFSAEMVLLRWE